MKLTDDQLMNSIKLFQDQSLVRAFNIERYPLKIDTQKASPDHINTRAMTSQRPIEEKVSTLMDKTCISDSIKLWLKVPEEIKNCNTKSQLKKLARAFALTLPV